MINKNVGVVEGVNAKRWEEDFKAMESKLVKMDNLGEWDYYMEDRDNDDRCVSEYHDMLNSMSTEEYMKMYYNEEGSYKYDDNKLFLINIEEVSDYVRFSLDLDNDILDNNHLVVYLYNTDYELLDEIATDICHKIFDVTYDAVESVEYEIDYEEKAIRIQIV